MAEKVNQGQKDMMIFVVSTIIMRIIVCCPAWFWVPFPSFLTYLTKAFDAI
ncbi:MAG: hypothetical protein IPJ43_00010 [Saprospiraceae bacterium]|nr:hypothetical protein [Saprospiraceae bacterium]